MANQAAHHDAPSFPDVATTPAGPAPAPIPYPNTSAPPAAHGTAFGHFAEDTEHLGFAGLQLARAVGSTVGDAAAGVEHLGFTGLQLAGAVGSAVGDTVGGIAELSRYLGMGDTVDDSSADAKRVAGAGVSLAGGIVNNAATVANPLIRSGSPHDASSNGGGRDAARGATGAIIDAKNQTVSAVVDMMQEAHDRKPTLEGAHGGGGNVNATGTWGGNTVGGSVSLRGHGPRSGVGAQAHAGDNFFSYSGSQWEGHGPKRHDALMVNGYDSMRWPLEVIDLVWNTNVHMNDHGGGHDPGSALGDAADAGADAARDAANAGADAAHDAANAGADAAHDATSAGQDAAEDAGEVFTNATNNNSGGGGSHWPF